MTGSTGTTEENAGTPWGTIPRLLDHAATEYGAETYLVERSSTLTFSQTRDEARRAAKAFVAAGVGHGDRVLIWAPNSICWIVACLGLQYIGATLVPANTRYQGSEAAFLLTKSRARVLITVTDFLGKNQLDMLRQTGAALADLVTTVSLSGPADEDAIGWNEFIAAGERISEDELERIAAAVTPTDLSDTIFTSGTTGSPKGVMLGHGQTLRTMAVWNSMLGLRRGDRYLILNPFFHVFGYKFGWLCSLMAGATVYPMSTFDPVGMLDMIEEHRITVVPGQPTIFNGLIAVPDLKDRDISSLRLSVIGSTTIPTQVIHDMYDVLGFDHVVSAYGLTETNGLLTMCRFDDDVETVATTVGRPIEGVEMRIVDPETNGDAETGEVVARGYNIMRGYFDEPDQTAAVFDQDGWLHTGDLGTFDATGSLRLTGRLKDMFIVGGFNVAPAEVEGYLSRHPGVSDVAVVGAADERLGEVGAAFVVRNDPSLDESTLIEWCRGNLSNFKVPRHVFFVDELPYSAIGKLLKVELRADARRRLEPAASAGD